MKRFGALSLMSVVVALEVFLSAMFLGGCVSSDRDKVPQSAIAVAAAYDARPSK